MVSAVCLSVQFTPLCEPSVRRGAVQPDNQTTSREQYPMGSDRREIFVCGLTPKEQASESLCSLSFGSVLPFRKPSEGVGPTEPGRAGCPNRRFLSISKFHLVSMSLPSWQI